MNYGYLSYVGDDERDELTSSQRRMIKREGGPRINRSRSPAGQVVEQLIYQEFLPPGKPVPVPAPKATEQTVKKAPRKKIAATIDPDVERKFVEKKEDVNRPLVSGMRAAHKLMRKALSKYNIDGDLVSLTEAYRKWEHTRWRETSIREGWPQSFR